MSSHSKTRKWSYGGVLKLGLAVIAAYVMYVLVDWPQAWASISAAHPVWLVLGGLTALFVWGLDALRLYWMTPIDDLPFRTHLSLSLQSAFVMQFGFGVFSADGYRVAGYALKSGHVFKPAAHIVAARIAGFASVCLAAVVATIWVMLSGETAFYDTGKNILKYVGLAGAVVAVLGLAALLVLGWVLRGRTLHRWLQEAIFALRTITARVWGLSLFMVLVRAVSFYCILRSLDINVALYVPVLASAVATLSALLPILGGVGVREGAFVGTTSLFGVDPALGISAALLMRLVILIAAGVGVFLSLFLGGTPREKPMN